MKITWKKQPNETGLRRVCQGPRGVDLRIDGKRVGWVASAYKSGNYRERCWFWVTPIQLDPYGIAFRNSAAEGTTYPDTAEGLAQAKADCRAYVEARLKARGGR